MSFYLSLFLIARVCVSIYEYICISPRTHVKIYMHIHTVMYISWLLLIAICAVPGIYCLYLPCLYDCRIIINVMCPLFYKYRYEIFPIFLAIFNLIYICSKQISFAIHQLFSKSSDFFMDILFCNNLNILSVNSDYQCFLNAYCLHYHLNIILGINLWRLQNLR